LYLIEYLQEGALPWGWPSITEDADFENLKGRKESWSPEIPPLQEFLTYARDQR